MKFYGLKNCDTCRKALKALSANGQEVSVIDVRADGVSQDDLTAFLSAFGEDLLNRRSTTWRGLSDAERAKPPVDLLKAHPTLMKRPVINHEGALYLGWSSEVQAALL